MCKTRTHHLTTNSILKNVNNIWTITKETFNLVSGSTPLWRNPVDPKTKSYICCTTADFQGSIHCDPIRGFDPVAVCSKLQSTTILPFGGPSANGQNFGFDKPQIGLKPPVKTAVSVPNCPIGHARIKGKCVEVD